MNVAQLFGEFALAPHVKVVITRLPERLRGAQRQSARDRLLERLQRLCEPHLFRFAHQQVDVLGHDDEAIDEQSVFVAHCLQRSDEEVPRCGRAEFCLTVIAAEGEVVQLTGLLEVLQ